MRGRVLGTSVLAFLAARATTASAFDYPEHAHISHRAIDLVTHAAPRAAGEPEGADDAARRVAAAAMLSSLAAALASTHLCGTSAQLAEDQPAGCFTVADIPALTGDHAASPMLTKWRWLNDCLAPRAQSALSTDLPRVVAALNTSSRTPEEERLTAPDFQGFIQYVRGFAPATWPSPGPDNMKLVAFDDDYLVLAERGHPHFRPGLGLPTAELASARWIRKYVGRRRSKPVNTAYAWYADQHVGALRFAHAAAAAGRDRGLLLAIAAFLELNAWHYLEDMVASGHMVADAPVLNNGALSATHDQWCKIGVVARLPPRLCATVARNHWQSLDHLGDHCRERPDEGVRIFGDHALAGAHDGVHGQDGAEHWKDPTRAVTEEWAVALVAESFRSVVDAALGKWWLPPASDPLPRCTANRVNDRAFTWDIQRGACGADPDQDVYRCMFQWWEGDDAENSSHQTEIRALFETDALDALQMIPEPYPPDRAIYPEFTFFSGNSVEVGARAEAYTSAASTGIRNGGSLGYTIVVPRSLFPAQLGLYAAGDVNESWSGDAVARPRAALGLRARVYYSETSRAFSGFDVEGGAMFRTLQGSFGADIVPIGVSVVDSNTAMFLLQASGGYAGVIGWRAGIEASFLR